MAIRYPAGASGCCGGPVLQGERALGGLVCAEPPISGRSVNFDLPNLSETLPVLGIRLKDRKPRRPRGVKPANPNLIARFRQRSGKNHHVPLADDLTNPPLRT